jgi:hypothetical protein
MSSKQPTNAELPKPAAALAAGVTGTQILVILIILIAGFTKANPANLTPFMPFGAAGIFQGASFVFFSFIGFDCVPTLAEDVRRASCIYEGGDGSPLAVHVQIWQRLMLHAGCPAACSTASNND